MIYHTRGDIITFNTNFLDADGNVPAPEATATVTIVFPSSVPAGNILAHDPGQLKGKVIVPMTVDTTQQIWTATWDSFISDPGVVFWNIRATGVTGIADDGEFILRGNLANIES